MRILSALVLPLFLLGCPSEPPVVAPGQTPPASPPPLEQAAATTPVTSFTGVWSTKDDQGEAFDMIIFPNGQAVTTWAKGVGGAKGERGFWRRENNRLIAIYEDGWTDVLETAGEGFLHKGFSPETPIGNTPTNSAPAVRVEGPAATYTGVWRMNREPDGSYQYVALFSGGRALSTVNGGTEGAWEATEKGARCTWPKDGWVDLIEHGPQGWQKRSWVGPESETPADISPVVRVGEEKFAVTP
jgi:hypothetical protein